MNFLSILEKVSLNFWSSRAKVHAGTSPPSPAVCRQECHSPRLRHRAKSYVSASQQGEVSNAQLLKGLYLLHSAP